MNEWEDNEYSEWSLDAKRHHLFGNKGGQGRVGWYGSGREVAYRVWLGGRAGAMDRLKLAGSSSGRSREKTTDVGKVDSVPVLGHFEILCMSQSSRSRRV